MSFNPDVLRDLDFLAADTIVVQEYNEIISK